MAKEPKDNYVINDAEAELLQQFMHDRRDYAGAVARGTRRFASSVARTVTSARRFGEFVQDIPSHLRYHVFKNFDLLALGTIAARSLQTKAAFTIYQPVEVVANTFGMVADVALGLGVGCLALRLHFADKEQHREAACNLVGNMTKAGMMGDYGLSDDMADIPGMADIAARDAVRNMRGESHFLAKISSKGNMGRIRTRLVKKALVEYKAQRAEPSVAAPTESPIVA